MNTFFPFSKKQTVGQKILNALPHRRSKQKDVASMVLHAAVYLSIFVAGYMVAQIQFLLS